MQVQRKQFGLLLLLGMMMLSALSYSLPVHAFGNSLVASGSNKFSATTCINCTFTISPSVVTGLLVSNFAINGQSAVGGHVKINSITDTSSNTWSIVQRTRFPTSEFIDSEQWFTNPAAAGSSVTVTLHLNDTITTCGPFADFCSIFMWSNYDTEPTIALSIHDSGGNSVSASGTTTIYSGQYHILAGSLVTTFETASNPNTNSLIVASGGPVRYATQTATQQAREAEGAWVYRPNAQTFGPISFTFTVNSAPASSLWFIAVFSPIGIIPSPVVNSFTAGGCTQATTSHTLLFNTTTFYLFNSTLAGAAVQSISIDVKSVITSHATAPIILTVYEIITDGGNTNPISPTNALIQQSPHILTSLVNNTSNYIVTFNLNLLPILPHTTYALAVISKYDGVKLWDANDTPIQTALASESINWSTGTTNPITSPAFTGEKIFLCGNIGLPSLITNVTNVIVDTSITITISTTSTSIVTSTSTRSVNSPDISSINYWLLPLIIVFVPFFFVLGAIVLGQRSIDEDTLIPMSLVTLTLTSFMGYAWNNFVPIYFGVTFAILAVIYFWRK